MNKAAVERSRRKSSLAFPHQPASDRGGFIRYLEESGAVTIFTEIFTALYNEPEKPENPLEWINLYLRGKAEDRKEELLATVESRRDEILQAAKDLEHLKMQKARYDELMQDVQEKLTRLAKSNRRESIDERFVEDGGDSRWQIKPDPMFVGTWASDEIAAQLANVQGLAAEAEDEIEAGLILVQDPNAQVSDFPSDEEIGSTSRKTKGKAPTATSTIPAIYVSDNTFEVPPPASASKKPAVQQQKPATEPPVVPFSDDPSFLPFYNTAEKSVETSPQPSNPSFFEMDTLGALSDIEAGGSGFGDINAEPSGTSLLPEINSSKQISWDVVQGVPIITPPGTDPVLHRKTVPKIDLNKQEEQSNDIWSDDFTLGRVESGDEVDSEDDFYNHPELTMIRDKMQGKRYRAQSIHEHSWLPLHLDHYEKEVALPFQQEERESEIMIEDVLGKMTLKSKTNEEDGDTREGNKGQEVAHHHHLRKKKHLARYEWVKKDHGVQELRAIRHGGAIKDDLDLQTTAKPSELK